MQSKSTGNIHFYVARFVVSLVLALAMVASYAAPSSAVGGQTGTLTGRVVDPSGAPVAGAQVVAASPSGTYRSTTDGSGAFTITGIVLDSYTVTITKAGYDFAEQRGVTLLGDQTASVGNVTIRKSLRTIARVTSRSATSAFQPTQTQDQFTFSGQRVTEAQGKTFNTDQTALIASSPGVQVDSFGNLSIRGSLSTEVGLNLDGVDYTSVDHGGAVQTYLNGIGSVSVNPGSGDATVGNSGSGVVNLVPKRGAYPPFGALDFEADTGYFSHQIGAEYGLASRSGALSDYVSFTGTRRDTPYGPYGQSLAQAGPNLQQAANFPNDYLATQQGYVVNNDFLNNLLYRFGNEKSQSLQFLFQNHYNLTNYDVGGLYRNYPYLLENPVFGFGGSFVAMNGPVGTGPAPFPAGGTDLLNAVAPLYPGQTSPTGTITIPPSNNNIVQYLKLEYDNNFNATTFLAARFYHISQQALFSDPSGSASSFGGSRSPNQDGGGRLGFSGELTKQLGSKNLVTLSTKYEVDRAIFSESDPLYGFYSLAGIGLVGRQDWVDFLQPLNTHAPLTFPTYNADGSIAMHGANDCPSSYGPTNGTTQAPLVPGGCWLYYYNSQVNPGFFKNGVPRIPSNYLNSPPNPIDLWAVGIRDQLTLSPRLRFDLGFRLDAANNHLPAGLATGNIGPDSQTNFPRVSEPRVAFAYQLGPNDAIRGSYGRSVLFQTGGTLYTPLDFNYYLRNFPHAANSLPGQNIPGTDFAMNPLPNVAQGGTGCGSGEFGSPIPYRACTSYADLIRWEQDFFAPDNGNAKPTTFNNFDITYSHQFSNGIGLKVTPFYKRGYDLGFLGLAKFTIDPTTGAIIPQSFRPFYNGFSKQTGVEMYVSTPERPAGLSGFLSATYVNSLANRPAGLPAEDSQPLVPFQALSAGNVYRSGYDSPLVVRTGFQYRSRAGIRINPVITYDRGYPIGSGLLTPVLINGVGLNVPSSNNAKSLPVQNTTGAIAYQYVDPTNPGNVLHPNFYANRGTPEGNAPGGVLSNPRVYADMTVELSPPHTHSTFGVAILNISNLYYSEPFYNTRYQPVATGVAGPLTGQSAGTQSLQQYGVVNYGPVQHAFEPYNLFPSNMPRTFRLYYQLAL